MGENLSTNPKDQQISYAFLLSRAMLSQMNPLIVVSEIKSGIRGDTETGFVEEAAFRRRVIVDRNLHRSTKLTAHQTGTAFI